MRSMLAGLAVLLVGGCTSLPDGIEPVGEFDLDGYLGKWYEIARSDHRFERGLQQVTADYSMRPGGGVKVINRGYATDEQKWKSVEGRAYPVGEPDVAHLKVSFFGPFYSSYCVFELDADGQHAFVCGADRSYLWLLSRTPQVSEKVKKRFLGRAGELGFDTQSLVWVEHGK
ncbi:MAG: lipocalin family protein [Verrucomicrobiales bacterium]